MPEDYLAELQAKREEVERRIRELMQEREYLDAIIRRRSAEKFRISEDAKVTRKNERQNFAFGCILQILEDTDKKYKGKGMATREIYNNFCKIDKDISYGTFRSYLHRLKKIGKIYQNQHSGPLHLTKSSE